LEDQILTIFHVHAWRDEITCAPRTDSRSGGYTIISVDRFTPHTHGVCLYGIGNTRLISDYMHVTCIRETINSRLFIGIVFTVSHNMF